MKRIGIVLAVLMFALPAWSTVQPGFEETTESQIVAGQQQRDLQKSHAALRVSMQMLEPRSSASSLVGAVASEGALWNSQSEFAVGGAGIFNIRPTDGWILKSFFPPPRHPKDMAYDGEFPWCVDYLDDAIYKIDPNTGQILESIPVPGGIPSGLTWDGENFWLSEWNSDTIYKINRYGVVLDSFPAPGEDYPYGLTWDGQYLWHSTFDTIYKIDPIDGTVVHSFTSPLGGAYGLAWDGEYLWVDSWVHDYIRQVDPVTGVVIHQILAPDDAGNGLAWGVKIPSYAYFPELTLGGGWTTTFALSNTGPILTTGTLSFTDQQGNPLTVSSSSLGESSSFPISILSGGTMFLTVDLPNPGDIGQSAWAMAEFEGTLSGVATYQLNSEGVVTALAGVLPSQPMQFATIPVDDNRSQARGTAYAIANPTNQNLYVKFCLVDTEGNVVDDTVTIELSPGEQIARYFFQDFSFGEFKGSAVLRAQGDGRFVAVALIENYGLFTVTPVEGSKAPNIPD